LKNLHQLEIICFPKDAWFLIDLLGILTLPNVVRLRAMLDSKMIGFIAADIRPSEQTAWIATIAVMPEFRCQGVGKALIYACEKCLTTPLVRLNVRATNQSAIRLYEKVGYQNTEIWPAYYQDKEDALVMEKQL